MVKSDSTRTNENTEKRAVPSTTIPMDNFDAATLKLNGSISMIRSLEIFLSDAAEAEEGACITVAPHVLAGALSGISLLLEGVMDDLVPPQAAA